MSATAGKSEAGEVSGSANAPQISLPKGGGAIRGIGEKFTANPVTGTGSMSVPIATSSGRSGFGPQISLTYDSGAGNSPFGLGWNLSLPSITRKTDKGLPQYCDAEESDVFILSGAEDMVPALVEQGGLWVREPVSNRTIGTSTYKIRRYRPRIEGLFARIERWTDAQGISHWRAISKDNITTLYGYTEASRIFDPADEKRIFSWLICESYDDKGNVIVYEYAKENSTNVDATQANERNRTDNTRSVNRYLKRIKYGNKQSRLDNQDYQQQGWHFQVVFDYGEGHYQNVSARGSDPFYIESQASVAGSVNWPVRHDTFSTYRAGFEVRTYRLCRRVLMFHEFSELGLTPCLVRSTELIHKEDSVASFITSVIQSGYVRQRDANNDFTDRYLKKSLPPVEYEYTQPTIQNRVQVVDPESLENLPIGVDGSAYQWTDLHGEGIPGILTEQAGAWFYKRNLSPVSERPVEFSPLERVATKPNLALAGGAAQLMDLAGDGQPDLVVMDGPMPGLYEHDTDEGWQPFRPFTSRLNRDMRDPNLKFVDLDGDGHADVLISEDDAFVWHASLAEEGFAPARRVAQSLDEEKGPRLVFADGTQSIYLSDMTGDGLTDLVRIRNGEVCYWPNLGYCRFGAKVSMDHAPHFDNPDQFDHKRLRLADIDGSGITDIIYLHRDGVRLYFNRSGNRWSDPKVLRVFPRVDDIASIVPTDLLGNGTACLVWSSPLPGDAQRQMRYVDLMGGQKPHLLVRTVNNLGAETRVRYVPSTQFYLQDKAGGKPWITKLPFPVHVVERVETFDYISRNRFVTRYAYHHGYFDGVEREFRGFGMVEQWDTELLAALGNSDTFPLGNNVSAESHVPPIHTKTWFHTGVYLGRERVSNFFAGLLNSNDKGEYFREPGLTDAEARALLLPDALLPMGLTLDEEREACRSLKGAMLRQEVYALDGTPKQAYPYTVTEQNFTIAHVQPRERNRHGVFFTHAREAISFHYERNPADPRIQHALTLAVDTFGNVLKSAAIAYGRRMDSPDAALLQQDRIKQRLIHITCTENEFTNAILNRPGAYRTPLPAQSSTYELHKAQQEKSANGLTKLYRFEEVLDCVNQSGDGTHDIAHEDIEFAYARQQVAINGSESNKYFRRLIEQVRTLYRANDLGVAQNNPLALLPFKTVESNALPGESYKLAFTPGLLDVYERDGQKLLPVNPASVLEGGGADRGGYVDLVNDGRWWIPSGRMFYSPDSTHTAALELAYARQHFFLPRRYRDPFHTNAVSTESFITYDGYDLLMTGSRDAVGNRVTVGERDALGNLIVPGNDYRVLQPKLVMDANRNRTQVAFDTFGMVVGTAVMGKPLPAPAEGDSIANLATDLTQVQIDSFHDAADPHTVATNLLQNATTRIIYDLDRFQRSQRANPHDPTKWLPPYAATLARETHANDQLPLHGLKIQISFSYSDGFGREIQKKIQAEPEKVGGVAGPPRWVGSGWAIFNNKGKPVRQFEPFFSATHHFEFGVIAGVSPVLFYDPAERVIATLHPNHTFAKTVFDPWQQTTYDVNDTVAPRNAQTGDPRTDSDIQGYVAEYFKAQPVNPAQPWQTWYQQRINDNIRPHERVAAQKAAAHADTPTTAHFDALGRPFLTVVRNRVVCANHALDGSEDLFATRVELDIEGNQRAVRDANKKARNAQGAEVEDPLGRIVMRYAYDMLGNRIHQFSMEAGMRWMLKDISGKPIRSWDSRGHNFVTAYDALRRPVGQYVLGTTAASDPRTRKANPLLVDKIEYGETLMNAEAVNLRTRIYRHFDSAGVATNARLDANGSPIEANDFKGNLLCSTRRLARDYKAIPDWLLPAEPQLDAEFFEGSTRYDALNRPIQSIAPHSSLARAKRNIIQPVFNEANLLDRVDVWLDRAAEPSGLLNPQTDAPSAVGISNIDYDAKGQRQVIEYKNGASTRYTYDKETFRLIQLYTRRGSAFIQDCDNPQPPPPATIAAPETPPANRYCGLQNLHYCYDPAGNITHIQDDAQQPVYFNNQRIEPSNDYTYDALYRLIEGTGREHLGQGGAPMPHSYNDALRSRLPQPGDSNAMGAYVERYLYDAVGNFIEMKHARTDAQFSSWTRSYTYAESSLIEDGSGGALLKTSNRLSQTTLNPNSSNPVVEPYQHDAHGNMLGMPHLQLMQWDYKDQLRTSQRQKINDEDLDGVAHNGDRTYYVYDAGGQRVRKVTELAGGNVSEERIYLGGFEIFRRHGSAIGANTATLERETLHIMDDKQRVALVETRTLPTTPDPNDPIQLIRYQFGNHLGSSSLELDEQAQIISYEEYTPYGSTSYQAVRSQTETAKRYRYTGKERDEESGLYYHGARYYAPWLGRWTKCDPAGFGDGLNLFAMTRNNPIIFHDPTGMGGEETSVVRPLVQAALEQKGLSYAAEVSFDVLDKAGKTLTSGRFDLVFLDPRTGKPIIPELKGIDLDALTKNQQIYKPMLESTEGAQIRITGSKASSLGLTKGTTLVVSGENYLVVGMENSQEFRAALDEVAGGGKIKHTFLDKSGKAHMFKTTEEFKAFLKETGRTEPKPPGGTRVPGAPRGFATIEALGLMFGAAVAATQYIKGAEEIAEGKSAEGAITTAEGSATLFMTFAPYAKGMTAASGTGAGLLTFGAFSAAAGGVALLADTARSAVRGEKTPIEVADEYYGSHLSDVSKIPAQVKQLWGGMWE